MVETLSFSEAKMFIRLKDGTSAETIFAEIRAKYDSTSWNDLINK